MSEELNKKKRTLGSDIWGVIFFATAFFILVSLISGLINNANNILGPVFGTYLSSGLIFIFGKITVFFFPLAVAYVGYTLFNLREIKGIRVLYSTFIVLESSVLLAIKYLPQMGEITRIENNAIGFIVVKLLYYIFGVHKFGPYFIFSFLLFLTVVLLFEINIKEIYIAFTFFLSKKYKALNSKYSEMFNNDSSAKDKTGTARMKKKNNISEQKKKIETETVAVTKVESAPEELYDDNSDPTTVEINITSYDDENLSLFETEEETIEDDCGDIGDAGGLIDLDDEELSEFEKIVPQEDEPANKKNNKPYIVPSPDVISDPPPVVNRIDRETIEENSRILQQTLKNFGIDGRVMNVNPGPIVSQYEIKLAPGVKISKIVNLQDDIAMAVGGKKIRIEAPIPGKAAVGIELPNDEPQIVHFKPIILSEGFQNTKSKLPVVIGRSISGAPYFTDIAKMPHLLVAGQTGSGKSVGINSIICSLLMTRTPEELRLILIDPKKVEMSYYEGIPHLLSPVVTESKEAVNALRWGVVEMTRRYRVLSKVHARNIESFNNKVATGSIKEGLISPSDNKHMPFIVIIVDELADLMMTASKDVEGLIQRIAQLARAVGIHLIVATQRPSVDIITGPIKANLTSRISFRTIQSTDSRTILGAVGAEKLLGRGDMLFLRNGAPDIERYHGAFISEEDVESIVAEIKKQDYTVQKINSFEEENDKSSDAPDIKIGGKKPSGGTRRTSGGGGDRDENFEEAARLVVTNGLGSTSLIQRRLKLGYARAGRVMDELEDAGIVGPAQGSKPREVKMSVDQLEEMFGD